MKKRIGIILSAVMTMCLLFCTPLTAFAASEVLQDGLAVSISADKETYNANEEINLSITVKNTNQFDMEDISVEAFLPAELTLKSGELNSKIDLISNGETVKVNVTAVYADSSASSGEGSPQTGDSGVGRLLLIFAGTVACGILAFRFRKQAGRVLGIFICIVMLGTSAPIDSFKAEEEKTELISRSVEVSTELGIPSGKTTVKAVLKYDMAAFDIDSDGDGLADGIEEMLGLDKNSPDSDGDGLLDGFEYKYLLTDLDKKDSDDNGISDYDEDYDNDGLSNGREQELGLRPDKADTDKDGVSDGDEVNVYHSDPLSADTDKDGLTDGEEVKLGLDPTKPSTDGTTPDAQRVFLQTADDSVKEDAIVAGENWLKVNVSGTVAGDINNHVRIKKSRDNSFDENRAVLSDVIALVTDYTAPLTLEFTYDTPYTGNIKNICILAYDPEAEDEEEDLKVIKTTIDEEKHLISGQVTGGGIYFAADLEEFLRGLGIDVNEFIEAAAAAEAEASSESNAAEAKSVNAAPAPASAPIGSNGTRGKADICFVLDVTGSMDDDIRNVANNINIFVEKLVSEYNIDANFSLISYNDYRNPASNKIGTLIHKNNYSNWFTNVNTFKKEVIRTADEDCGRGADEVFMDGLGMAKRDLNWRGDASKFVVLLTDESGSLQNRYGYKTREELADAFDSSDICVSVITLEYLKSSYEMFWTKTDGIYADIKGNFADILLGLANKIGAVTNKGEWVLLQGYKAVRLKDTLANADKTDSDEDGLSDKKELNKVTKKKLTALVEATLKDNNVPAELYKDKAKVEVWKNKSNPVLPDSDFDGINDADDKSPLDNKFNGDFHYLEGDKDKSSSQKVSDHKAEFTVDYSTLFGNNTIYNDDLSVFASVLASDIYEKVYIDRKTAPKGGSDDPTEFMSTFGLKFVENIKIVGSDYGVDTDDCTEITIGYRDVVYGGTTRRVTVLAIRGTNGTNEEWSSNFDVGADTPEYYAAAGSDHPHWRNKQNHKGFDVCANRILDVVKGSSGYLARHGITGGSILITGHSRGAAIADIVGKTFEDDKNFTSFTYTFAAPNQTRDPNAKNYKTIFNVINTDDLIPYLPLDTKNGWGFEKYGVDKPISVADKFEDSKPVIDSKWSWEWLVGKDYNNDGGTQRTISAFSQIAASREDVYKIDMTADGSCVEASFDDSFTAQAYSESLQKDFDNEKLSRFCTVNRVMVPGRNCNGVEVRYCPAFLMQMLANMTTKVGPMLGYSVSGKYYTAKTSFIKSSGKVGVGALCIGGMTHPHEPITYYLIAHNGFDN